jgi:hypothetical protein
MGRLPHFVFSMNRSMTRTLERTMSQLRVGTSSFTAEGWETAFYPSGLKDADRLTYYATKFDTLEIDATFYRTPSRTTVQGWYRKTPADFLFALKVPQVVTHEKVLVDAHADLKVFLDTAGLECLRAFAAYRTFPLEITGKFCSLTKVMRGHAQHVNRTIVLGASLLNGDVR